MSELHNEDESLLALLYRHNLGLVIENIVEHVGHTATVNMLCTCKSWLAILSDIVPLRRLLFLRYVRQRNFAKLCDLNRWSVAMSLRECERPVEEQEQQQMHPIKRLAYINYTTTDLRRTINRNLFEQSERYFAGGMATALLYVRCYIICGLIGGHIKMWDTSETESWHRIRLFRVLAGHNDDVTALSTHGDVLASGARDKTIRLWHYESGDRAFRVLKASNRHLERVSLTRNYLICLHHCSANFEFEVYKSKAVLFRIGATFDAIDEVRVHPLGHPPYRVMHSYALDGRRLAYALHNAIRVVEAIDDGFETLFEVDLDRRTFVKESATILSIYVFELHMTGNLLMSTTIDNVIRFTDISTGQELATSDIPSSEDDSPNASLSDFGIVLTYPESRKALIWHWVDLLAGRPGTEMKLGCWKEDISFAAKRDSVVVTAKGVVFLDQLGQGFHAFWFRRPNWMSDKVNEEDEDCEDSDELT